MAVRYKCFAFKPIKGPPNAQAELRALGEKLASRQLQPVVSQQVNIAAFPHERAQNFRVNYRSQ
jgi:hypothetical protein